MVEYNDELSAETERAYQMAEIIRQRSQTIAALNLRAGDRVVDVGCGPGLLTREIALAVGESGYVLGIDVSESMLNLARRRSNDLTQIELKNNSADTISAPDNSFDAVTCTQLLLYLPNVAETIQEMARVLKPGGRIAIIETDWRNVLFECDDQPFMRRLFASWEASLASPYLPGKLQALLSDAGFWGIKVEAIPIINTSYLLDNYSGQMVAYSLRESKKNGTLTDQQAEAFVAELKQRSAENRYFFCVNRFLFTAVKY